jgi:hypothetical protein
MDRARWPQKIPDLEDQAAFDDTRLRARAFERLGVVVAPRLASWE